MGQGTAFTKSQPDRPPDVQAILLYGMPFLTLSPEIRRFNFFVLLYSICKQRSVSELYLLLSCSVTVTLGLNMVLELTKRCLWKEIRLKEI